VNKSERFDEQLQNLARFAKILSHPARLAILKYLSSAKTRVSGNICASLPLGRTTISQHLKELRDSGIIIGQPDGLKVNYRLNPNEIKKTWICLNFFFKQIKKNN